MLPRRALVLTLLFVTTAGCAVLEPNAAPEHVVRGPLGLRSNGPIAATLMQFRPRSTQTRPVGRVGFEVANSYSSMFEDGTDGNWTVVFDGELARTAVLFRTGVSDTTDVEVELPFAYATSGFLDTFIESWHAFFGLPNGGRAQRARGEYAMHVDTNGRRVYELDADRPALADIPLYLTQQVTREADAGIGIALRGGIEIPTGSEGRGFGNGGVDWGGGALAEKSLGRFTFTASAYYVDAATPDSFARAGLVIGDQVYYQGGVECRWNNWLSLVAGLRSSTPVTKDIPLKEIDRGVLDLDVGFVFDDPQTEWRYIFGLTEDLVSESGTDFTVFFGLSRTF